jgi:hypothetical protein
MKIIDSDFYVTNKDVVCTSENKDKISKSRNISFLKLVLIYHRQFHPCFWHLFYVLTTEKIKTMMHLLLSMAESMYGMH